MTNEDSTSGTPPNLPATLFAGSLERAINTALDYDPGTRSRLDSLQGQRFKLICTRPRVSLGITVSERQVFISAHPEGQYDAEVEGDLQAYLRTGLNGNATNLTESGLRISGSISAFSRLQGIAANLDIDWADAIARYTHPLLAHTLETAWQQVRGFAQTQNEFIRENLESVLADELQWVPGQIELEDFYDEIDRVSADAQRFEARLRRLKSSPKATR